VGGHQWELTHMQLSLTGRVLLIRSLNIHMTEDESEFSPVSPE
jgi:hypothetical protein